MKHLPPTPPFFLGSTSVPISLHLPSEWHRRMGNRSCGQFITCCLCQSFLLTLLLSSSLGPDPWETIVHELLQCGSFPQAAILHELLQHGSLPWGAVLQEQTAPAWVPHGVTSPASKLAAVWASISTGSEILPVTYSSVVSPGGHRLF